MKLRNKFPHKPEGRLAHHHAIVEADNFHDKRLDREMKVETKKEFPIKPEGNDEYEQLIAEEAAFNAKPMIEEAAFFIAERRSFAPGKELSDWLEAEIEVESSLRSTH